MRPQLFTLAAGVSTVLHAAVCVLWFESHRWADADYRIHVEGTSYTIRMTPGQLTAFVPPPGTGSVQDDRAIAALVSRLKNEQVRWQMYQVFPYAPQAATPVPRDQTPAKDLAGEPLYCCGDPAYAGDRATPPVVRPLIAALDDPDRLVAAHVLLNWVSLSRFEAAAREIKSTCLWSEQSGSAQAVYDGLAVELLPKQKGRLSDLSAGGIAECDVRVDPAQFGAIRNRWVLRLCRPTRPVRFSWLAATTALVPLLWLGLKGRRLLVRQQWGRHGLCPSCGYDLRGTPDRCPECGAAATSEPLKEREGR